MGSLAPRRGRRTGQPCKSEIVEVESSSSSTMASGGLRSTAGARATVLENRHSHGGWFLLSSSIGFWAWQCQFRDITQNAALLLASSSASMRWLGKGQALVAAVFPFEAELALCFSTTQLYDQKCLLSLCPASCGAQSFHGAVQCG